MVRGQSKQATEKKSSASKPRLFSFKKLAAAAAASGKSSGSSWKAGGGKSKESKAVFSLVRAKYQKGDKEGEYTGAIYFRGKPRYGTNEKFKEAVSKHLHAESLRWNDQLKLYTAKVYTAVQASKVLEAMRSMAGGEADLPEKVDETVFAEVGEEKYTVSMAPVEVNGEAMLAVTGATYLWKEELKAKGFKFENEVNGHGGVQCWLAPAEDVDKDELSELFSEYGFVVEAYDGMEEEEEEN